MTINLTKDSQHIYWTTSSQLGLSEIMVPFFIGLNKHPIWYSNKWCFVIMFLIEIES
jgi:hypothetical protein